MAYKEIVCYGCGFPVEIEYDMHRDVLRAKMCNDCLKVLTDTAYQLGINAARTSEYVGTENFHGEGK
jgi:NMD protein affecting ribosome stability and mRNA decay